MARAQLARAAQVFGVVEAHPARALHQGLDDERGDLALVGLEQGLERARRLDRRLHAAEAVVRGVAGGKRREQRFAQQRRVGVAEDGDVGDT